MSIVYRENVYREYGYNDREDYLICIAEDYGLDLEQFVRSLAELLGPNEDFDGLVSALEDPLRSVEVVVL